MELKKKIAKALANALNECGLIDLQLESETLINTKLYYRLAEAVMPIIEEQVKAERERVLAHIEEAGALTNSLMLASGRVVKNLQVLDWERIKQEASN